MKKLFLCLAMGLLLVSNCFAQADKSIWPQWLVGDWVVNNEERKIWIFNAYGALKIPETFTSKSGEKSYATKDYVVIEKVLAITNHLGTETYDMIVSKDNQVLILRKWGSSESYILRKK